VMLVPVRLLPTPKLPSAAPPRIQSTPVFPEGAVHTAVSVADPPALKLNELLLSVTSTCACNPLTARESRSTRRNMTQDR